MRRGLMDLLHNVVLLRCPDSDKEFTPVSPSTAQLSASLKYHRLCTVPADTLLRQWSQHAHAWREACQAQMLACAIHVLKQACCCSAST